jgi:hypothetical protein
MNMYVQAAWFLLIISALDCCTRLYACPYYTLGVPASNYTDFQTALQVATAASIPLHICLPSATVSASELNQTIVISTSVTIVGDIDEASGERAYLTFEENDAIDSSTPVFSVTAGAAVTIKTLQFTFFNTLFEIGGGGGATLHMYRTSCWFGRVCVQVNADAGSVTIDHGNFMANDIGILYIEGTGTVVCADCHFVDDRLAGIVSRGPGTDSYQNLKFSDIVFINILIPFGVEKTATSNIIAAEVTENFVHNSGMINAETYTMQFIETYNGLNRNKFASAAGGGGGGDGKGNSNHKRNTNDVLLGVFIGLLVMIVVAATIACIYRQGKRRPQDNKSGRDANKKEIVNIGI